MSINFKSAIYKKERKCLKEKTDFEKHRNKKHHPTGKNCSVDQSLNGHRSYVSCTDSKGRTSHDIEPKRRRSLALKILDKYKIERKN